MGNSQSIKEPSFTRDPLLSSLERRKGRRKGYTPAQVYQEFQNTPDALPPHLDKCLEIHRIKPWLEKRVKTVLVAHPLKYETPPKEAKKFYTNIPYTPFSSRERTELESKGEGYVWYLPSKYMWQAHCYIHHQKGDYVACANSKIIRTFFDSNENARSFIFGVIFTDGSFRILDEQDYEKECEWWDNYLTSNAGMGERKMFLKNKRLESRTGRLAREKMKEKVEDILPEFSFQDIENKFIQYLVSQDKTSIYDYVELFMRILIFLDSKSAVSKYTTTFKYRVTHGYYSPEVLTELSLRQIFPQYYVDSNPEKSDKVRAWVVSYLQAQIDEFFTLLVIAMDPTVRQSYIREKEGEPDEEGIKEDIITEPDTCPDISKEDAIIYKDKKGRIFCFNINDLVNRENDLNPFSNEPFDKEFLREFDREFRDYRPFLQEEEYEGKYDEEEKERRCALCNKKIKTSRYTTGTLVGEGKADIYEYCSAECLEESKNIEDSIFNLFGEEDTAESIAESTTESEEDTPSTNESKKVNLEELQAQYLRLTDYISNLEKLVKELSKKESLELVLAKQVEEHKSRLDEKERELNTLRKETVKSGGVGNVIRLTELETSLQEERKKYTTVLREMDQKLDLINRNQTEAEEYKAQVEKHQKELAESRKEMEKTVARMNDAYLEIATRLQDVQVEKEELDKEISELEKKNEEIDEALRNQQEAYSKEIETLLLQCNTSIQQETREKERLNKEEEELRVQIEKDKTELEATQAELIRKSDELLRLQKNLSSLEEKTRDLPRLESELQRLQEEEPYKTRNIQKLQKQVNDLGVYVNLYKNTQQELGRKEAQILALSSRCPTESTMRDMDERLEALNKASVEKDQNIFQLQNALSIAEEERARCMSRDIEKEITELKSTYEAEIARREEELKNNLQEEARRFQEELQASTTAEYQRILKDREEYLQTTYTKEINRIGADLQVSRQNIQQLEEERKRLNNQLSQCSATTDITNTRASQQLGDLQKQLSDLNSRLQQEMNNNKLQTTQYEGRIAQLQEELSIARNTCMKLTEETKTTEDINSAIKKIESLLVKVPS